MLGKIAPVEKFKAHIPDIERPHRFEIWKNKDTGLIEMWYKNLRQQNYYWNKEPLLLMEKGIPDIADLEVETISNSRDFRRHIKGLASIRSRFMQVFKVDVPQIQSQIRCCKDTWTEYWDMFSEPYTEHYTVTCLDYSVLTNYSPLMHAHVRMKKPEKSRQDKFPK
jgi:hypothetical protein